MSIAFQLNHKQAHYLQQQKSERFYLEMYASKVVAIAANPNADILWP